MRLVSKLKKAAERRLQEGVDNAPPPPPYRNKHLLSEAEVDRIVDVYESYRRTEEGKSNLKCNLVFDFVPERRHKFTMARHSDPSLEWSACLRVRAHNIPGLMRDGFHWSAANIRHEGSSIDLMSTAAYREGGVHRYHWKNTQIYKLKNLPGEPVWEGSLYVFTKHRSTALRFDINCITPITVAKVKAFGMQEKMVYYFEKEPEKGKPAEFCNTLLRDNPLDGWWPLPKRDGEGLANRLR